MPVCGQYVVLCYVLLCDVLQATLVAAPPLDTFGMPHGLWMVTTIVDLWLSYSCLGTSCRDDDIFLPKL